jgi:P-type Cu2+ transporter
VSQALRHARWSLDAGQHEHVVFAVEGLRCAACVRAIERALGALPGVDGVRVNGATARVAVDWRGGGPTDLAQILGAVERAGFVAVPLAGSAATEEFQRERRAALKRVGLAALGMMQAMMYLGALYGVSDISESMAQLMRVTGMVIVTPVLFYSGAPFLVGAWRDLRGRRLGMDVPVAMALLLAWLPSVLHTLRGSGEVYFDSIGMFVFFLSAGRFIEMSVRHRGLIASEALSRSLPSQVTRIEPGGAQVRVPARALAVGDRFLVPRGGVVAVDAQLAPDRDARAALLDESLLTGESAALRRGPGEHIRGGSLNVGAPLTLVARRTVEHSTLASLVALLERAQAQRPALARAADRMASWFVLAVLLLAAGTGLAWWQVDPSRAFTAVLAVLVVTCPCALSLATPAAFAAAATALARRGLLVLRGDAVERLARVDTVVLDKTGTLTGPEARVGDVTLTSALPRERVLAIAAALEAGSAHPLAAAFAPHARADLRATDVRETPGEGLEGRIDGAGWRLGRREFAQGAGRSGNVHALVSRGGDATVYLGGPDGIAAAIQVASPLRGDAHEAIAELRRMELEIVVASGDSAAAVGQAARALDIRRAHARLSPVQKIALIEELRGGGRRVFMIGDGINDGPVLACADVSCAMGQGSAVAQSAADLLLAHENLSGLPAAIVLARRTMRVVRQNLGWSLVYNLAAVPLAALGWIPPWVAALGMSLSSLAVVLNARRLARPEAAA